MATASATPMITCVDDDPGVVAALAALEPLWTRHAQLTAEHAAAHRIGGYTNEFTNDSPRAPASAEDILRARLRLDEIPRELQQLRVATLAGERALDAARSEAKAVLRATIDDSRCVLIAGLVAKLRAAQPENDELVRLDALESSQCGVTATWAWHELADEPLRTSRLTAYEQAARAHGLL